MLFSVANDLSWAKTQTPSTFIDAILVVESPIHKYRIVSEWYCTRMRQKENILTKRESEKIKIIRIRRRSTVHCKHTYLNIYTKDIVSICQASLIVSNKSAYSGLLLRMQIQGSLYSTAFISSTVLFVLPDRFRLGTSIITYCVL